MLESRCSRLLISRLRAKLGCLRSAVESHHAGSQFSVLSFSSQMADDQGQGSVGKQGAGDSESEDTVDAKPDRSSFVSSLLRWVSSLTGPVGGPGPFGLPRLRGLRHPRGGGCSGEGVYAGSGGLQGPCWLCDSPRVPRVHSCVSGTSPAVGES